MNSKLTDSMRSHVPVTTAYLSLVLALAVIIATSGTTTLPMDGHEVFVVQTAQEMHDRNDWIVPWFNGEPRLNKPPLNYWLTGIAAWLSGSPDHIEARHGRSVSMLAGLVLTMLAYMAGVILYGRRIALLAAAFMVTSLGFFNYSHDARPDMLYAALCSAGYVAFIFAWKSVSSKGRACSVLLMWAAYALATLAKGPHLPAMYLAASGIFCMMIRMPGRETLQLFRPVSGLLLFTAITLPWWYLMQHTLGEDRLRDTQLSGSLLTLRFDQVFNFYYFYRPLLLVLPWLVFLPHTVLYYMREHPGRDHDRLLMLYILVPVLVLSFGSQQRWFYLLPSLLPMLLLLAAGANHMLEQRRDPERTFRHLLYFCLAAGVLYVVAGHRQWGWSSERFEFYALAQHARAQVRPDTPVYTLNVNPDIYVYYLGRPVRQAHSMSTILQQLDDENRDRALLIMQTSAVTDIPAPVPHRIIYTTRDAREKTLSLVLLQPGTGN